MTIINSGVTKDEAEVYSAVIQEGVEDAAAKYSSLGDSLAAKIGTLRPINTTPLYPKNPLSKKIPNEILFPIASAAPEMEDISNKDRSLQEVFNTAPRLPVKVFSAGYSVRRRDFYNDIFAYLSNIPKLLTDAALTLLPKLFARLLRTGTAAPGPKGNPFFSGKNLRHHAPLSRDVLREGLAEIASRCGEDGECLGLKGDTLIVPPGLFSEATEIAKDFPEITQVVELAGLVHADDPTSTTTWYLASCLGPRGALALLGAVEEGFELLTNMSPFDPTLFLKNQFAWAVERYAAVGYGNPAYITRFEAGGPSQPHPDDLKPVGGDPENSARSEREAAEAEAGKVGPVPEKAVEAEKTKEPEKPNVDQQELISIVSKHTQISVERISERIKKTRDEV